MFTLTSSTVEADNGVTNVYRDREAVRGSGRVAVIHNSHKRGGCLYAGTITLRNLDNGRSFSFPSTSGPWDSATTAVGYVEWIGVKVA